MLYLATPASGVAGVAMREGLIGYLHAPHQGRRQPSVKWWAADNGAFSKSYVGDEAWFAWLSCLNADGCLFATAPDVVGDASATLERSMPWLPRIRNLGFPASLVAQDGLEGMDVPWNAFDALFIGGSTEWKLGESARQLTVEAKARGKWVHMGRVNSRKRYEYARRIGIDSVDGTYLTFGPSTNLPKLLGWVSGASQGLLGEWSA